MLPKVQLVVARFEESLDWLRCPPWDAWSDNCVIYNKGASSVPLEHLPPNAQVVALANVGRDMHSFLYHAYLHYGEEHDDASCTLADVTVFLPGSMVDKRKSIMALPFCEALPSVVLAGPVDKVISTTDLLRSETFKLDAYTTSNASNRAKEPKGGLSPARVRPLGAWYRSIFNGDFALEKTAPLGWCGIQSVSRNSVRQRPRVLLRALLQELEVGPAPEEVHYVERIMTALWRPVGLPRIVWLLWFQGWHEAPPLVLKVRDSWKYHNPTWDVRCIDAVHPVVAQCKWNSAMEPAAWSDAVRLQLLTTYGGVWADATMACLRPLDTWVPELDLGNTPSGMWMFYGPSKPKVKRTPASWFMLARPYTYIFCTWLKTAAEFWKKHNPMNAEYAYFWMDECFLKLHTTNSLFQKAWDATLPKLPANEAGGHGPHGFILNPTNAPAAQRKNPSRVIKLSHKPSPHTQAMIQLVEEHMVPGGLSSASSTLFKNKVDRDELLNDSTSHEQNKAITHATGMYIGIGIGVAVFIAIAASLLYFGIRKRKTKQ